MRHPDGDQLLDGPLLREHQAHVRTGLELLNCIFNQLFLPVADLQAECSVLNAITASVVVPVNVVSHVALPLYGILDAVVTEGSNVIWSNGQFVPGTSGVLSAESTLNAIIVTIGSGAYNFALTTPI